jgi:hypothetical protein
MQITMHCAGYRSDAQDNLYRTNDHVPKVKRAGVQEKIVNS